MFSPDIVALRQFYAMPLGMVAGELIAKALAEMWPQARDEAMLGIGYCLPYLEPYLPLATPLMVCMPAHQGAACWPPERANLVFLAQESDLPLPDNSINRVLLMHSVEHSEHLPWMIEDIWRVLVPGGRVLAVVPNRLSFWARSPRSPFGYGRPFSMAQLRDLMTAHHFTLTRTQSALFMPPLSPGLLKRVAPKLETFGRLLCPFLGGVLLVEAEKQIYAAIRKPVKAARRQPVPIPAARPVMGLKRKL